MLKCIYLYLLFLPFCVFSQHKEDAIWMLGYGSSWHDPDSVGGNTYFNFNEVSMQPKRLLGCTLDFEATSASMSDENGNLLFYTNGTVIANAEHDTMENGAGLSPGPYMDLYGAEGVGISQWALILPFPGHKDLYYILHQTPNIDSTYEWYPINLLYTLVDMSANGGKGKVLSKNQILLADTICFAAITACRHANGRDWWLMLPQWGNNCFYRMLLSPQGFSIEGEQCIGYRDRYDGWQAYFSPDGTKYARHGVTYIHLYDFDRCTGTFSNPDTIGIPRASVMWWLGGISFSPNSRYLYFSAELFVYQLDTDAPNVAASRQMIAEYDSIEVEVPPGSGIWLSVPFWFMGLAPNGKIYIVPPNAAPVMHVIEQPDLAGTACNLVQRGQPLPTINAYTIPNFPDFRLGALAGSGCDTLLSYEPTFGSSKLLNVYPNPAAGAFWIENVEIGTKVSLYNILGEEVKMIIAEKNTFEIFTSAIPNGIYLLQFQNEQRIWKQKLIIQK